MKKQRNYIHIAITTLMFLKTHKKNSQSLDNEREMTFDDFVKTFERMYRSVIA